MAAGVDAATLAYVLATRPPFDLLRQAAGQLAGILLLAAVGSAEARSHPGLPPAAACCAEAHERLRRAVPTPRAAHHHRHLLQAAAAVGAALTAIAHLRRHDDATIAAVQAPLQEGYRHLQWAAGALPGFEIVAFAQGCCASHPAVRTVDTTGGG